MILRDFLLALRQIGDPAFRRVLVRAVLLTLAIFGPFVFGFSAFVQWIVPENVTLPFIGQVTFLDNLASGLGLVVLLFLSSFVMVPVASVFIGFFLDEVADAVEARHYPHLGAPRRIPLWESVVDSLRFVLVVIVVNLLALVIYLASSLLAPVIFWLVNGWLLGREYFQLVAMRRLDRRQADAMRRRHVVGIWIAGILMAIPLSVPLLGLFVPILGVATFTHQFHRLAGERPARTRAQ